MKIFMMLDGLEKVSQLAKICEKYKEDIDVDIVYGRYTLDGCSVLMLTQMIGKNIRINPITDNQEVLENFVEDIKKIGVNIFE